MKELLDMIAAVLTLPIALLILFIVMGILVVRWLVREVGGLVSAAIENAAREAAETEGKK